MRKTITKDERLQLLGLLTLARHHAKMLQECETEEDRILDDKEGLSHLYDGSFNDDPIDVILEKMGVVIGE